MAETAIHPRGRRAGPLCAAGQGTGGREFRRRDRRGADRQPVRVRPLTIPQQAQKLAIGAAPPVSPVGGFARNLLRGAAWGLALRWGIRLAGMLNTIILARLLTPTDFGVVAIAMLVVSAIEILGQSGQKLAILRLAETTPEHHDSAWTLSVATGTLIAFAVFLSAPLAALFFHEPRAVPVIQLLALRPLFAGCESLGATLYRKSLNFRREFRVLAAQRAFGFVIMVGLALALRNYWALAIGTVAASLVATLLSFAMHPYRPRFRLSKLGDLWGFSNWILAKHLGTFLAVKFDQFLVGSLKNAGMLASYAIAVDLGTMVVEEIRTPLTTAFYPVLAGHQSDRAFVARSYLTIFALIVTAGVALEVGIALVSPDLVLVVLGAKWRAAIPLLPWLALAAGITAIGSTAFCVIELFGRADLSAKLTWLNFALAAIAIGITGPLTYSILAISIARFVACSAFAAILLAVPLRLLPIGWGDLARSAWRPVAAGAAMALAVLLVRERLGPPGLIRLITLCGLGAIVYGSVLFGSWVAAGGPVGPERMLVDWIRTYRDRGRRESKTCREAAARGIVPAERER